MPGLPETATAARTRQGCDAVGMVGISASNKCVFVKIDFLTIPKWPTPATWNICLTNFKTGRKTRLFCPKNGLCFTLSGGLLY
jgi:hypothetical protein